MTKPNNEPNKAREAATDKAFETWLVESRIDRITPRNGHAKRAFDAGYECGLAELEKILRLANIEVLPDGSHQFKPKAIAHYCGELTAKRMAELEVENERYKEALTQIVAINEHWGAEIGRQSRQIARDALEVK